MGRLHFRALRLWVSKEPRMSRFRFTHYLVVLTAIALASCAAVAATRDAPKSAEEKPESEAAGKPESHKFEPFKAEAVTTTGSVTIGGRPISYQAIAGTIIVHPRGWDDVPRDPNAEKAAPQAGGEGGESANPTAEASMFYVYYAKAGGGPRPIVTSTDAHTAAAPYSLINNAYSLLDATDMVFIDAPGTGFSRVAGKDKEKAFFGVDADAYAFSEFISQFLTK